MKQRLAIVGCVLGLTWLGCSDDTSDAGESGAGDAGASGAPADGAGGHGGTAEGLGGSGATGGDAELAGAMPDSDGASGGMQSDTAPSGGAAGTPSGGAAGTPSGGAGGDGSDCMTLPTDTTEHCGALAHDCGGGACLCSVCQPLELAHGINPGRIAVNAKAVFFTEADEDRIDKVALTGGDPVTIAENQPILTGLALDETNVYWANRGNTIDSPTGIMGSGVIKKAPLDGGAPVSIAENERSPYQLVVNAKGVYWVNAALRSKAIGQVRHLGPSDAVPTTLAGSITYPTTLAVDANYVYFPDRPISGARSILKVAVGGGQVTTLTSGHGNLSNNLGSLQVDGSNVYYLAGLATVGMGALMKVPLAGGSATPILSNLADPGSIAIDATHVYWTDSTAGTVNKIPLAGGEVETLATGQPTANYIAIDEKFVYWTRFGTPFMNDGAIMKVAKTP